MLMLAMPLLFIPDLLIRAWIGGGFHGSYAVMAILAGVLLVHQPIYVLTQFLIARGRQRSNALVAIGTTAANLALSFALAATVGVWGVAVSTLVTDVAALLWIVPRIAAPAAETRGRSLYMATLGPAGPGLLAGVVVFAVVARLWSPATLLSLVPLGLLWLAVGGAAVWRFGLDARERSRLAEVLVARRATPAQVAGR
jgi:O-antigen/teichoic acid export membrane protein